MDINNQSCNGAIIALFNSINVDLCSFIRNPAMISRLKRETKSRLETIVQCSRMLQKYNWEMIRDTHHDQLQETYKNALIVAELFRLSEKQFKDYDIPIERIKIENTGIVIVEDD